MVSSLARFSLALLLIAASRIGIEAAPPLQLKKGQRVVFIGNSLFDRMRDHPYFEAMVHQHASDRELTVRNLAWSADEIGLRPRPENFGDIHSHLTRARADLIIAAYGFNESFRGLSAIPEFEAALGAFLASLRRHHYNGRSPAQIILVSPIAHETLPPPLPDGSENNLHLQAYTAAMARIAAQTGVTFVDLFTPTQQAMRDAAEPLTFNGVHLTDHGYRRWAELFFRGLFGQTAPSPNEALLAAVKDKNRQFFYRYRPLNQFYITGGRAKPYGVVNFPGEMEKLEEMVADRDRRIWAIAAGRDAPPAETGAEGRKLPSITGTRPINTWMTPEEEAASFDIDPRFRVNCFASEEDFPELACPIQMRWDSNGRLWVSTSTTYPMVYPGQEPNDRIIILEDTDEDGKADKVSVFADKLAIPLSFEFGDGGVYVSEQPHLLFLKDTDGDGRADTRRILLSGFGSEDSHHSLHDFTWSPDGDLLFREGIFHHSQVETPYGPVRARESSFFRYRPATQRLTAFGNYRSTNPWGLTFDDWGQHQGSHPVFASAVHALSAPYPEYHLPAGSYLPAYSGTCGQDFIFNSHFPDELQGHYVRVRYKPINAVEIHEWEEHDTHFLEKKKGHLIFSRNLSFIPVDVRFGPRGALYICDWYNPVKGHMQYSLRDTRRDRTSGRIWRVTARGRPLADPPQIAGQTVDHLLDLLKAPEYRTRYWARRELRDRDHDQVNSSLDRWVARLDPDDPRLLHHRVEAVWVYRGVGGTNPELLESLLEAPNPHARAAATRQLRYWHRHLDDPIELLRARANDTNGLVRLEAAIASSYIATQPALEAALDLLHHPMDNYLTYALRTAIDSHTLKPYWLGNQAFNTSHPELADFITASEPAKGGKRKKKTAEEARFDELKPKVIRVGTVPERMLFTLTRFKVGVGEPVKIILTNPDATPHNLAICRPGTGDDVGMAANEMAKIPGAFEKMEFLPASENVLVATEMVQPGQSSVIRFHAPDTPGEYPYICTFPGHWLVMRGSMIVE